MKHAIFVIIGTLSLLQLKGQDAIFFQYNQAPLFLNPAATGPKDVKYRVSTNYRYQGISGIPDLSFHLPSLSFDKNIKVSEKYTLGGGIILQYNSFDNPSSQFSKSEAHICLSYKRILDSTEESKHILGIGMKLGSGRRSFYTPFAIFPSDHDGTGGTDTNIEPSEIDVSKSYFDAGMGVNWLYQMDVDTRFSAGISLDHMNTPDITLLENSKADLYLRYTLYFHIEVGISNRVALLPSIYHFIQGPHKLSLIGSGIKWNYKSENPHKSFNLSINGLVGQDVDGRILNGFVTSLLLNMHSITTGISYLFPTQDVANHINVIEFSFGYTFK